jgi:hypothetical protein
MIVLSTRFGMLATSVVCGFTSWFTATRFPPGSPAPWISGGLAITFSFVALMMRRKN